MAYFWTYHTDYPISTEGLQHIHSLRAIGL